MPKQPHRKPAVADRKTNPKIEHQIDDLRKFHTIGNASVTRDGIRMKYGSLKSVGTSLSEQEQQRKARVFAMEYTPDQLDELLAQCRSGGFVLTTSHIKCLLAVKKLSTRNQLQKKVILNKWSIIRLQLEQRRLFGSRRHKASAALGR